MPPSTDKPDNDPPPTAANVASAYPTTNTSPASRLLAIALIISTLSVAIVHYSNHPLLQPLVQPFKSFTKPSATTTAPPTTPLPPTSLAVCYSGHLGTHSSVVSQNLQVVSQLDPAPAVFYYIDLNDDYHHEETNFHYTHPHTIGALQAILNMVNATVETFSKPDVVPPSAACFRRQGTSHLHYSHNYIRFYAAQQCYRLVQRFESERLAPFEWILHLRPDMNIAVTMPPSSVPPRVHLSGAAMALVPRKMADSYFNAVKAYEGEQCKEFDLLGDEPCRNYAYDSESTECLLIKWLKREGITPSNGVYVNRRIVYPAPI